MERKKKHARSRSFTDGGGAGGVLASFLRSTAASFSSSTFASHGGGNGKTTTTSFNHRNAFSGPMISIVPPEARGGRRNKGGGSGLGGYRTPEASSPKVSCIGQIKKSKSKRAPRKVNPHACGKDVDACPLPPKPPAGGRGSGCRPKSSSSLVKRMFFRRSRSRSSSKSGSDGFKGRESTAVAAAPAPAGLGQMKRFTSGRPGFQDFDWREAERRGSDDDDENYEVDDGFVAHSAPLVLGGGVVASEPRKEVNLWRRRPMSPPTPLQLP